MGNTAQKEGHGMQYWPGRCVSFGKIHTVLHTTLSILAHTGTPNETPSGRPGAILGVGNFL